MGLQEARGVESKGLLCSFYLRPRGAALGRRQPRAGEGCALQERLLCVGRALGWTGRKVATQVQQGPDRHSCWQQHSEHGRLWKALKDSEQGHSLGMLEERVPRAGRGRCWCQGAQSRARVRVVQEVGAALD